MKKKHQLVLKNTFQETYLKFNECVEKIGPLSSNQQSLVDSINNGWMQNIDDDKWLIKFERIVNLQSLLGFKSELNCSLTYDQLIDKVGEHMAEIDIVIHLISEFPISIGGKTITIQKVLKSLSSYCDFSIDTIPPHYVESKYVKAFKESTIVRNTEKALSQIQNTGKNDKSFYGVVWIFTYDQPDDIQLAQRMVDSIAKMHKMPFKYFLNVQVYNRGLYGDASFRVDNP